MAKLKLKTYAVAMYAKKDGHVHLAAGSVQAIDDKDAANLGAILCTDTFPRMEGYTTHMRVAAEIKR